MPPYIFFARHGQTRANELKYLQTQRINNPLTDIGKTQAQKLGNRLKEENVKTIISSPAIRTLETAHIIRDTLKLSEMALLVHTDLLEINGGDLEGLYYDEITIKYSDIFNSWFGPSPEKRINAEFPGGESFSQVVTRGQKVTNYILGLYSPGKILVVGHGSMNNVIISLILELKPEEFFGAVYFDNCGLAKIKFDGPCGQPQLIF